MRYLKVNEGFNLMVADVKSLVKKKKTGIPNIKYSFIANSNKQTASDLLS